MTKYTFDSCTSSAQCQKCDIGYILRRYVKPLMQTLTNDVRNYYMRLLTTKCLNTAVMLGYFMLGKRRALKIADYCDTEMTRARHQSGQDNNTTIMQNFSKDILSKRCSVRYFYYILLTDGKFPNPSQEKKYAFFPGHVFILEKIPSKPEPYYYFYQSYINQYDLNEHVTKNNNSLKLTHQQVQYLVNDLSYILNAQYWDALCTAHWKNFTFVDASYLQGHQSKGNFFMCFKKAKVTDCLNHIEAYTQNKLDQIQKNMPSKRNEVYGDASLYEKTQKPLTYGEMYANLKRLQKDIVSKSRG
jgi:hypothetical protein